MLMPSQERCDHGRARRELKCPTSSASSSDALSVKPEDGGMLVALTISRGDVMLMPKKNDAQPLYLFKANPALAGYYPRWVDNLAEDATLEGSMLDVGRAARWCSSPSCSPRSSPARSSPSTSPKASAEARRDPQSDVSSKRDRRVDDE